MSFAILLNDVRSGNELVGWTATVYPIDGYDRCDACEDHSKPMLGCQYSESTTHYKDPKDAIRNVARVIEKRAKKEGTVPFHIPVEEVQKFVEQLLDNSR